MIHARLIEAGTEMGQMYNGGWLIAWGLTELNAQCKTVCSEVLFFVYFWAFFRTKNQDSSSFLGVFISTSLEFAYLLCPAYLILCFAKKAKNLLVCLYVQAFWVSLFLFPCLSGLLGFDRESNYPAILLSHLPPHRFNLLAVSKLLTMHGIWQSCQSDVSSIIAAVAAKSLANPHRRVKAVTWLCTSHWRQCRDTEIQTTGGFAFSHLCLGVILLCSLLSNSIMLNISGCQDVCVIHGLPVHEGLRDCK